MEGRIVVGARDASCPFIDVCLFYVDGIFQPFAADGPSDNISIPVGGCVQVHIVISVNFALVAFVDIVVGITVSSIVVVLGFDLTWNGLRCASVWSLWLVCVDGDGSRRFVAFIVFGNGLEGVVSCLQSAYGEGIRGVGRFAEQGRSVVE